MKFICAYEPCGKEFDAIPSRIKHGRGKHCSPECQYAHARHKPHKETECICLNCGESFFVGNARLTSHLGTGKYCCRPCRDTHWIGENTPNYIDGSGCNKYGANWQSQKRKTVDRDGYTCRECGRWGDNVHHIIPFRHFGIENYELANDLSNLKVLCESCHRSIDAEIQRLERMNDHGR